MTLDQVLAGLIAAAFGVRTLDSRRGALARVGYGLVAYDLVKTAWGNEPLLAGGPEGGQNTGLVKGRAGQPLKFQERQARTIAERVAFVHEQMVLGTRDPAVYSLAREVLNRKCGGDWCVKQKDHWGEAVALFNEVKGKVRYTWDPLDYDAFQRPRKTLALRTGDCDDMVSLLGAMCRSIGLQVRSRIIQTTGEATWNHIYLLVHIPEANAWRPMDLTVQKPPGWEVPQQLIVRKRDFDVLEKSAPKLQAMMGL